MIKLLLILFLLGCGRPQPKPVEPADTHMCKPACKNLQELECPEGDPIDGISCEEDCINIQQAGHALNPTCVAEIHMCSQLDTCLQPRR